MICVGGVTWTDENETHEYFEKLSEKYGSGIVEPSCGDGGINFKGCGKTTCYIIIDDSQNSKNKHWWLGLTNIGTYGFEGQVFIPIRVCHRCSAAHDGWLCGLKFPEQKETEIARADKWPMTPAEIVEYKKIFEAAYKKARNHCIDNVSKVKTSRRYLMKE